MRTRIKKQTNTAASLANKLKARQKNELNAELTPNSDEASIEQSAQKLIKEIRLHLAYLTDNPNSYSKKGLYAYLGSIEQLHARIKQFTQKHPDQALRFVIDELTTVVNPATHRNDKGHFIFLPEIKNRFEATLTVAAVFSDAINRTVVKTVDKTQQLRDTLQRAYITALLLFTRMLDHQLSGKTTIEEDRIEKTALLQALLYGAFPRQSDPRVAVAKNDTPAVSLVQSLTQKTLSTFFVPAFVLLHQDDVDDWKIFKIHEHLSCSWDYLHNNLHQLDNHTTASSAPNTAHIFNQLVLT